MRTATSAHRQRSGALKVRGPHGPHADGDVRAPSTVRRSQGARASRPACGRGRPRTVNGSALKVRGPHGPQCGRRRPRTVNGPALSRYAGLPARMRTGTYAHRQRFGALKVRGPHGPHADGDVRAPSTVRRSQGTRASRPACGRGRPRTVNGSGALKCAGLPARMRTGTSAHRQRFGALKVRGPPGPQCGRGRPRTVNGSALSRCAGFTARSADGMSAHRQRVGALKVRGLHGPQFGRGRAPPPDGQHFYPPLR